MDEATKNRVRLWLRSERALGLTSVGPGDWSDLAVAPPVTVDLPPRESIRPATRQMPATPPPVVTARAPVAPVAESPAPSSHKSFSPVALSVEERKIRLTTIDEAEVRPCTKCQLSNTRSHTVFGEGAADARLIFIGEGPGFKEDQSGRPFVGPAGELLNRMIGAMGLKREQVYIANIVKCRAYMAGPPAKDRAPSPEEVAACSPYLERQVEIIQPQVIVTLGLPATQFVLQTKQSMSRMRGTWSAWHGIKVMPTWHPAYMLRREKEGDVEPKRQAWGDLQKVMAELGLSMAKKG